jgi:outer membrane protein TolC
MYKDGMKQNAAALRNRFASMLLCFLLFILTNRTATADERKILTLEQMIQMALQSSSELKMAEQDILAAKGDYMQARGGQFAQLDINAMTGPTCDAEVPTVVVKDGIGHLVSHDHTWDMEIFGRLDFVIAQPLYTFGKITYRKEAAALDVEAQQAARDEQRNRVVLNVKELYYAYLVAIQGKGEAREADDFLNDARKRIKRLVELKAKNVDQNDLYRLDSFSGEAKAFAVKADSGARVAYIALKKAIGLPENEEFRVKVTELPKDLLQLDPEEEYVLRALERRPEILEVKKGVGAKGKLADAAKADLYPSIYASIQGSVAGAPDRQHFDNSYVDDAFNHHYAGIVMGAQWHFDLGIGKGKLARAKAEHQKIVDTLELAKNSISVQVVKYYQDAIEAQKSYEAYEQAAIGSRRWMVSTFSNFDLGIGTARDMFEAIDRYGKNQGEHIRSLYNYHVSLARLDYATGRGADVP